MALENKPYINGKGEKINQYKLNGKTLSDLDINTGQITYHRHKIKITSDIYEKEVSWQGKTFTAVSFYGFLDDSGESASFQMNENGKKSFDIAKVEKGDEIEVFGKPYQNKKTGALMTIMSVRNLTKGDQTSLADMPFTMTAAEKEYVAKYKAVIEADASKDSQENFITTGIAKFSLDSDRLLKIYKEELAK